MRTASALVMRAVRKRYGRVRALDGLDLAIPRGSVCGLVGPNGAGKTTAFGIVGGFIRADGGEIDLLGAGPFEARTHSGRLTLLPQDAELNPHVPVRMLLVHYARLQGQTRAVAQRDADRVLDLVRLRDRAGMRVRHLSHGMRRRVAIAQALLGDPELVLLDEPTSGLDPHLVVEMRELFAEQRAKRTLVVSSHILGDLEVACDHVVFMEDGRAVRSGAMSEVTGRGDFVRIVLESDPHAAAEALRGALDGDGLVIEVEGEALVVRANGSAPAAAGDGIADLNARVLRALLDSGARIAEVRRGHSLEAAYMRDRARR